MRLRSLCVLPIFVLASSAVACGGAPSSDATGTSSEQDLRGPGSAATDQRVPELGGDLSILAGSKISLADGVAQVAAQGGAVIEAKFELADDQKSLSLSIYPAAKGLAMDSERNVFQEASGDPTASPWAPGLDTFADQEHLTRSSRDLTLVQMSRIGLADAIQRASCHGNVFWAIPTMRHGRAGFGVYTNAGTRQSYTFIDGEGSRDETRWDLEELGDGPGDAATDARAPELKDLSVLASSKITMRDALAQVEAKYGGLIEAKFEPDDSGNLSLSIYPVGKGLDVDAERNTFFEASGDPTQASFAPSVDEFKVPDVEHLTRAARDLTIVQAAGLGLRDAVSAVEGATDGFVYWAIPTIRDTRAGYGVYVYGADGKVHYYFVS